MLQDEDVLSAVPRITEEWLAGFFDGEGSVSSYKSGVSHTICVTLTQKDPKILTLIDIKLGGTGKLCAYKGAGNKVCHRLRWNGRAALPILEAIKDFVIVKRRQVEIGITFCKLINEGNSPESLSPVAVQLRAKLDQDLKALNFLGNESGR